MTEDPMRWRTRLRRLSKDARPAVPQGLSDAGTEIMRAVVPVVVGPLMPADPVAREESLQAAIAALDDYLAYMSIPVQRQARMLLGVLHLRPVRRWVLGTPARWSEVAPERIEAFLRRAHGSRFYLLRRTYDFLQSMSVLAWFDVREAWADIGYPGPPVERPMRSGDAW